MNEWGLVVVMASVFVAVVIAVQGMYWAAQASRDRKSRDLSRRLGVLVDEDRASLFRLQVRDELTVRLGGIGDYLESLNVQAGRPTSLRRVMTWMLVLGLLGVLSLALVTRSPLAVVGLVAGLIPMVRLQKQAERRARELSEQLPDALDLIARSLQAGHGLSDAMRMCAEEMPRPIAWEFGRVYEEHNLGRDFRECLANLNLRNPHNFDLKIFTSSVLLQRDTGGNLIEILNNISSTIRARFIFRGKVRALTAEAKFSGFILGGLPLTVATLIFLTKPNYLDPLLGDPLGKVLLMYGISTYVIGIIVMTKMAKIDV